MSNQSNSDSQDSGKTFLTSGTSNLSSSVSQVHRISGSDIKFPIFNGNGLEFIEQPWFLCEVVCTMRRVQDKAIKRAKMITNFRGRALDWYMMFYVVHAGTPRNSLDQNRYGIVDECNNPKYELQCITKLKEIKKISTKFF